MKKLTYLFLILMVGMLTYGCSKEEMHDKSEIDSSPVAGISKEDAESNVSTRDADCSPSCSFFNNSGPEDLGVFDFVPCGNSSWTHVFAPTTATSVIVELCEVFTDNELNEEITIDGVTLPGSTNGNSLCGPPKTHSWTFSGSDAAFANDGTINITYSRNGDCISLDWARVTILTAETTVVSVVGDLDCFGFGAVVSDADGDEIPDDEDNCPETPNTDQADADEDGVGNVCDNCPDNANEDQGDNDGDGVGNVCDNCPENANQDQADADADGLGDACDDCPLDADNDIDGDGVCGDIDNCPTYANPDQADNDGDGEGDVCDPDDDNDGVLDGEDNCPFDANSDQANHEGDSEGDVCDDDDDNDGCLDGDDEHQYSNLDETVNIDGCDSGVPNGHDTSTCGSNFMDLILDCQLSASNHGDYVSCVAQMTNSWKAAGLISGQQKGAIQSCAAQSNLP